MKTRRLLSIAGAAAMMLAAGAAEAAPAGGVLDALRTAGAHAGSNVETVHWRRYRHCHWYKHCWRHRWHRHCRWVKRCHRW